MAESTLVVPESLVEAYPRAARYVGLPLGWVGCWEAPRFDRRCPGDVRYLASEHRNRNAPRG